VANPVGYIDEAHELIIGLQADSPLKRAIMPNGGLRMVDVGLQAYSVRRAGCPGFARRVCMMGPLPTA
jgi:pyruvate-formate lyase